MPTPEAASAAADDRDALRGEIRRLRAELQHANERNDELRGRLEAEQASAVHFAQQLRDLRSSRSWRITLPLRLAMRRTR